MADAANNTAIDGYFQQKIIKDIIKIANVEKGKTKFKSFHTALLEKKLDDGWNRMRGKMKNFVDYDAFNSDDSSEDDGDPHSYSYKFLFEPAKMPNTNNKKKKSDDNDKDEKITLISDNNNMSELK